MSAVSTAADHTAATAPRERGWLRLLLAIALVLVVPLVAQLRVVVPLEQTVLFIAPALASCALAGWARGGKWWLVLAWGGMSLWILFTGIEADNAFDSASRAWAILATAAFGVVGFLRRGETFFPQAVTAVAVSMAVATVAVAARPEGPESLARAVESEYSRRLDAVSQEYERRMRTPEWRAFTQRFPRAAVVVAEGERQLPKMARGSLAVFPAFLGLETLALLALAWTLYHRSSRARLGRPLARLAEFRFSDQLVWGFVLGITLLVLPSLSEARPVGLNLAVFFGALYALRGFGVLAWFWAPAGRTPALLVLAALLAGPVVGALALGLGLADTWIDWRRRERPPA